jgi:hypothetical protein
VRDEKRDIEEWRFIQLCAAGCDAEAAVLIAERQDVDLHQACDMLAAGCPVVELLQILL